jgi:hypothetical protein
LTSFVPRRSAAVLAVLALSAAAAAFVAPAAAQDPKPENPVGPVSYRAWHYPGKLPKDEPQSAPAPYGGQALVLQTSYVGRKSAEPTLGVDRDGTAFYAASDFDGPGGATARTEVRRSDDGGLTWRNTTFALGGEDFPPSTLDPYVYVDQLTGRVFSIDLLVAGSFLAFSDDKGATWAPSAMEAPGVNDHQTLFTGPPPEGNPTITTSDTFPNVVHYCVNALADVSCSFSTDGGETFRPMAQPPFVGCVGCQTGHGVVDSKGRVFLPRGGVPGTLDHGRPEVAITEDGGLSWDVVTVADGPLSANRHTAMAVDKADNLYYVWYDADQKLPYLSVSEDNGRTWGTPLMVAPPGVHDANFPMVAAGDVGRIAISFPGSSVDDQEDETRPWHAWVVVSSNALDPDPLFLGAIADNGDDPLHRGSCDGRCAGMFDFLDLQVSPADGTVWGTFTDTCTAENGCTTERADKLATDAQGIAVRTLFGPRLNGGAVSGAATQAQTVGPKPSSPRPAAPDRIRPSVRSLRVTRRHGVSYLHWRLSERASVRIAVRRGRKTVARTGSGRPATRGKLKLGRLRRGPYTVRLVATDPAGNRSKVRSLTFRY